MVRKSSYWLVVGLLVLASAGLAVARNGVEPQTHPVSYHLYRSRPTESFILASDAVIRLGTNSAAQLTDLKVGQTARVSYTIENGLWFAHEIVVNPPRGSHAGSHSPTASTNTLHAHGAILSYNAATGNLTIRYHR
jgi:hypothetical protein